MLLQTISVANWLQDKLNAISESQNADYKFKIFGDIGYNKASNEIKGVLKSIKGDIEPLKNDIDIEYAFVCELSVPSQNANYDIINVRKLIDELIIRQNATSDILDDGDCLFTFSTTLPKDYKIEYGVGTITPLYFVVYVRYTQNAVTSANKHWFLNEFEIPFLTESVLLDKDGMLNKISGKNYSKALITGQTKFYKFTFQYDIKNDLCIGLQKDILNGDFEKTYTLKYYDGVAYTEQEPFTATVSIYKNADSGVERTKTGMFNVTFVDADNGDNETKYYLALIDTPFDMSGENTRNFIATVDKTAKQVQIEYFESQVLNGAGYEQIKAPNLNSIDITSQIYRNTKNYDLFDLVNKNYAIIKIEKNGTSRYYYYFVTNASIGAGNQVIYDLKLDTLQTYFFDDNINFAECMIEKAHLNRFVQDENNEQIVRFNLDTMIIGEELPEPPKILTKRQSLNLNAFSGSQGFTELNKWLNDNVAYWVYAYMDKSHAYKIKKLTSGGEVDINTSPNDLETEYRFINNKETHQIYDTIVYKCGFANVCYPIFKDRRAGLYVKSIDESVSINISELGFMNFLNNNAGTAYLYNLKISEIPPFNNNNFTINDYSIDKTGKILTIKNSKDFIDDRYLRIRGPLSTSGSGDNEPCAKAFMTYQYNSSQHIGMGLLGASTFEDTFYPTEYVDISEYKFEFKKSEIINQNRSFMFNPKLRSQKYVDFNVLNIAGEKFSYDLQKMNKNNFNFIYSELIQPEITKSYLRLNTSQENSTENLGLYNSGTQYNYLGLVSSNDTSLPVVNEKYNEFIANNKNFWLQTTLNVGKSVFEGLLPALPSKSKNKDENSGFESKGIGILNNISSVIETSLSIDNMKNSPDSLKNAQGNIQFNLLCSNNQKITNYYEIHSAINAELKQADDYMYKYGFNYNMNGQIKDYINIRKYFNYIKANLDAISGVAMSNTARADLSTRFANGVRFWNSDDIQYEKENYENWLEN